MSDIETLHQRVKDANLAVQIAENELRKATIDAREALNELNRELGNG